MEGKLQKGYQMEELLLRYFMRSGHFTVRGVPFAYQGFEVTDIDVWAYDRPSPFSRQRIVVDSKNRSTPKAIERIFWTKGLQEVLGLEQAVVATTDKRPEVTEFGREHGVVILDGNFLTKLEKSSDQFDQRLTEEQFVALIASYNPTNTAGDWKKRVKLAKQLLVVGFGYNAMNGWISEAQFFAEQMQLVPIYSQVACRVLYLLLSFIAVATDFVLKDLAFSDAKTKLEKVNDGLRHGSGGASNTNQVIRLAVGLIERYAPDNRSVVSKVRTGIAKDLDSLPTQMLAEYFCKPSVSQDLFSSAKELEGTAYSATFVPPSVLPIGAKSLLALFVDFWGMDRSKVFDGSFSAPPTVTAAKPSSAVAIPSSSSASPENPSSQSAKPEANAEALKEAPLADSGNANQGGPVKQPSFPGMK